MNVRQAFNHGAKVGIKEKLGDILRRLVCSVRCISLQMTAEASCQEIAYIPTIGYSIFCNPEQRSLSAAMILLDGTCCPSNWIAV